MPRPHALFWFLAASACGGAGEPPARRTVFDPTAANVAPVDVSSGTVSELEKPYPPLDRAETPGGVFIARVL